MRRRPYGPTAWLIDDVEDPVAWAEALRARGATGIGEIVPAQDTIVVRCDRSVHGEIGMLLESIVELPVVTTDPPLLVDVRYDGADLAAVADLVGLTVENTISLHLQSTYRVVFCGFSPGFAYLTGLDARLQIPRRSRPRTSVPAGSVAIAAEYSCIYPSTSPGGWHVIGTAATVVWDIERDPPALLRPGRTVHFRRVDP